MQVTYFGHSCFQVIAGGKKILFDPFISANPLASQIDVESIETDYIFVSHAHDDHTADLLPTALRTGALVVGIWEVHMWCQRHGITNTHPLNIGGSRKFDFGRVKMIQAVHSSSFADGTYGGSPAGYYFETGDCNFYYSGDTALYSDMQMLSAYPQLDIAFLPIGDNFTMGAEDAAMAATYIQCDTIIGMHYDTFGYIKIDHEEAIHAFKSKGKNLILMKVGETINVPTLKNASA